MAINEITDMIARWYGRLSTFIDHRDGNFLARLGDKVGAKEFSLRNSDDIEVMSVDSLGASRQKNVYLDGDKNGLLNRAINFNLVPITHFRTGAMPDGFAWAGAPFATPSTIQWSQAGDYGVFADGTNIAYLYKSIANGRNKVLSARYGVIHNASIGFRIDDGTDNNYVQAALVYVGNGAAQWKAQQRTGGGAVVSTDLIQAPANIFYACQMWAYQNTGSTFVPYLYWLYENGVESIVWSGSQVSWIPTRMGFVINAITANKGGYAMIDWWWDSFS